MNFKCLKSNYVSKEISTGTDQHTRICVELAPLACRALFWARTDFWLGWHWPIVPRGRTLCFSCPSRLGWLENEGHAWLFLTFGCLSWRRVKRPSFYSVRYRFSFSLSAGCGVCGWASLTVPPGALSKFASWTFLSASWCYTQVSDPKISPGLTSRSRSLNQVKCTCDDEA